MYFFWLFGRSNVCIAVERTERHTARGVEGRRVGDKQLTWQALGDSGDQQSQL